MVCKLGGDFVGRIITNGVVTEYSTAGHGPYGITVGPWGIYGSATTTG